MKDKLSELLKNIKKIVKDNKNVLGILCLFIIIQPFLDILPLFTNPKYEIFGFTIPTLVRCGFIGILTLISLKKLNNKKDYLFLGIYAVIVMIYTLIHHVVVKDGISMPSTYTYSLFSELFYIVRMMLPLSIIYFTRYSKITYKKFINTILISSLTIGLIIFIGNSLCVSYTSYDGTNGHTLINWVGWFFDVSSHYKFADLTSKGWFYMANQVGGLMMMLLPFCLYDLIKEKNNLNFFASLFMIISMIILGTRTASYGWVLIVLCFIFIIIFLRFIKKETWWTLKRISYFLIICIIGIIFLTVSPSNNRVYGYKLGDISNIDEAPIEEDEDAKYAYILDNYSAYGVQDVYILKLYNYKFDPEFWLNTFKHSAKNGVIENREMQTRVSNRIKELNNDKLKYKLFGYSFSRMRNGGIYMEHDFIVQVFTMGYLGLIIFIGPYIVIMALVFIKILKKMKKYPKLVDFAFMISIGALLGVSIFTGHLLDELFVMIYAGFICGFFLRRVSTKEVKVYERD